MGQIDYRKLPSKGLYLYMNLVMGFCEDMRRMLREGMLTKDTIDKYELTVVNNIFTEVNSRSQAASCASGTGRRHRSRRRADRRIRRNRRCPTTSIAGGKPDRP